MHFLCNFNDLTAGEDYITSKGNDERVQMDFTSFLILNKADSARVLSRSDLGKSLPPMDAPLTNHVVMNYLLERLIKSTDNLAERLDTLQGNFEKLDQRLNEHNDQIKKLSSGAIEKPLNEQNAETGSVRTNLEAERRRDADDHRHQLIIQRRGFFNLKRQLLSSQETCEKRLNDQTTEIANLKGQIAELGNLSYSLQAEIASGDQRQELIDLKRQFLSSQKKHKKRLNNQTIEIANLKGQIAELGYLSYSLQAEIASGDQRQELTDLRRQLLSSQETFIDKIDIIENNVQKCTNKKIVSFFARVKPSISDIDEYTTIKFATVETNIGNAYDSTSGEFTAPVAGVYVFFATILTKPKNYIETVLKVNYEVKLWLYSGDDKYYGSSSNLLVSHLNKGDKVKMTTYCCGSKPFYIHHRWSTFSGFLIVADEHLG